MLPGGAPHSADGQSRGSRRTGQDGTWWRIAPGTLHAGRGLALLPEGMWRVGELPGTIRSSRGHLRGHPRAVTLPAGHQPSSLKRIFYLPSFRTAWPSGVPGMGSLSLSLTLQGPGDKGSRPGKTPMKWAPGGHGRWDMVLCCRLM